VAAAWRAAGITVEEVADIRPAQWEKTILNATVGPLCLALAAPGAASGNGRHGPGDQSLMAAVWSNPRLRGLCLEATREGGRIAAAAGIAIAPGLAERAESFFAAVGAHRPSVLRDPGELPWVLGHLRAAAAAAGVPIPALDAIAAQVAAVAGPQAVLPPGLHAPAPAPVAADLSP
jgi:ketopantoate reductase